MALYLAAYVSAQDLTAQDRERGLRYLEETRKGVVEATKGLSDAQLKFKPSPDRWSIAEVVEHLALTESAVQNALGQLVNAPAATPGRDPKELDALILTKVPDRSERFKAPPTLTPTGRWLPAEALERFLNGRARTVEILASKSDLRGRLMEFPALGKPLDGYEWILAVAAHSARHTKQIQELKADPGFPTK
jgi:hypothetical protein